MVVLLTLRHYSRTSNPSDKNVYEEAKKLHVLPFHDVTLWKSNFTIRVVYVKGEELEASGPYHSTGSQDDRHRGGALDPGIGSLRALPGPNRVVVRWRIS